MLSPSAAPRWKIATRTFLRPPCCSAAKAARWSQSGAEPVPAIAIAELRRKILRETFIHQLPALKIRRPERKPGNHRSGAYFRQPGFDGQLRANRRVRH